MKKLVQQLREAKTWQERVKLAENKTPHTKFDDLFALVKDARFFVTVAKSPGDRRIRLEAIGEWLANVIEAGDSRQLCDMAKALNIWKRHEPEPDQLLIVLFELAGMFPRGWKRTWATIDQRTGRVIRRGLPATKHDNIAMRDIEMNLRRRNPAMRDDAWKKVWLAQRKRAQRYAKTFSIKLDPRSGRPPKKTAT
jgi:hypothetical protein